MTDKPVNWKRAGQALTIVGALLGGLATIPSAWGVVEPIIPATHAFVRDGLQAIEVAISNQELQFHDQTGDQLTKLERLINITNINALRASSGVLKAQLTDAQISLKSSPNDPALINEIGSLTDQITAITRMMDTAQCNLAASGQTTTTCQ